MPKFPRLTDLSPVLHDIDGKETTKLNAAARLYFNCPKCGKRLTYGISMTLFGWTRTGDSLEDMTLSPSIRISHAVGGECWHGNLIDGKFRP